MANTGRFKDRSPDIRPAGLASVLEPDNSTGTCMTISHIEELAEHLIRQDCKRRQLKNAGLLYAEAPCLPNVSVPELMAMEKSKSRFMMFKEKMSEDMYLKQAKLGEVMPTGSKPDHINNLNTTFGCETNSSGGVYDIILPRKPAEQVNREYGKFHDKYILSHNHYFPSEQINRRYKAPFDRRLTYGAAYNVDVTGKMVKRCMQQCAGNVIIISKEQMDFIDRTYPRLGKKLKKYPYSVPQHVTFGRPSPPDLCDGKMLIEDISPCQSNKHLIDALGHLNMWRHKLQLRADFQMFDLISVLEHSDKEQTRHLPLKKIFEVMHKMHLYIDIYKMRTTLSHFKMILDENCPNERVNYDTFCQLLNIQHPLPTMGNISMMPPNVYNKDTTYRLLCADLGKTPVEAAPLLKKSPKKTDDDNTRVKDLLTPDIATLYGLLPSDFQMLRPRDHLEEIFKDIVSEADFETIWQQLMNTHKDQDGLVSIVQFRDVMDNIELAGQTANA
ncbi:EF-hand domain-containing family member B [Drosophila mojavensis]|uniref:EFHB C-terminal EF-hand domain-containing protein n=1 Tax=Drosophila mojavensis TaxID=7230 RepID=B4KUQ4_DROMO|nr:EF-hand domain-containing family member B [Drosophila mojavensis]EDW19310.1 uncharacterized protein Dmoj_GI11592 [Drosophila mojavensis]